MTTKISETQNSFDGEKVVTSVSNRETGTIVVVTEEAITITMKK